MAQPVKGTLNYMADAVESSLLRNGKVSAVRDAGGTTSMGSGVNFVARSREVHNARLGMVFKDGQPRTSGTLEAHGFELCPDALRRSGLDEFDFDDNHRIVENYYPTCVNLVKQMTGAEHVFAFDHNIRTSDDKQMERTAIKGGNLKQGPASVVHGDYTLTSASQRLRDLAQPPTINDTMKQFLPEGQSLIPASLAERSLGSGGRFGIINVWRNISRQPVKKTPLALCDGQTVTPEDLVTFEIHYADRIGENYFAKEQDKHAWYYYPKMTRDEALLIKQWDSAGSLARTHGKHADVGDPTCTFSFHSAFDYAEEDNAPERESIEVRCIVIWPSQPASASSKL